MTNRGERFKTKRVRPRHGDVSSRLAQLESRGWELVSRRDLKRSRTELTLRRPWPSRRRGRFLAEVAVISLLATGFVAVWGDEVLDVSPTEREEQPTDAPSVLDSDADGLPDATEEAGWQTAGGTRFETDPLSADSDGDGLTDGAEAGDVAVDPTVGAVYAALADPTEPDSDGDTLDDATELDADLDAWSADSDGDGLDDMAELEVGADPLSADPDGDGTDDAEEMRAGSDPILYDLTSTESAAAVLAGAATFGNRSAADFAGLSAHQLDSWQFLLGSLAKRFVPLAAIREAVTKARNRDFVGALLGAGGAVPVAGATLKIAQDLLKFAGRTDAGAVAALALTTRVPVLDVDDRLTLVRNVVRLRGAGIRLDTDEEYSGTNASSAMLLTRPVSAADHVNARKDELVAELESQGFADIRVNERQINSNGRVVGGNRVDVQATSEDGVRHYYDLGGPDVAPSLRQLARALSNDPNGEVHRIEVS